MALNLPTMQEGRPMCWSPLTMLKEKIMMREVFLGAPWGGRSCLILLLVPLLLFGCTRELEEKLAGKERELSGIQTALSEVQDKLATA